MALLDRRDRWHAWSAQQFSRVHGPLLACEAVITEACFRLQHVAQGADAVTGLVERGVIDASFRAGPVIADLRRLMRRYGDVPMAFADACLVRMSEERAGIAILTLDSDFRRYRRLGRQVIPLITPAA